MDRKFIRQFMRQTKFMRPDGTVTLGKQRRRVSLFPLSFPYGVERRTSEIGVRMALGANRSSITRLVLRGAFLQIVIGLLLASRPRSVALI